MMFDDDYELTAEEYDEAFDQWEATRFERQQAELERLDAQGYFDDPLNRNLSNGG